MKMTVAVVCIMLYAACSPDAVAPDPAPPVTPVNPAPAIVVHDTITIDSAVLLCGSDLAWLKRLTKLADEDAKTKKYNGRYVGTILTYPFNGKPAFLLLWGASSVPASCDCDSARLSYTNYQELIDWDNNVRSKKGKIVYRNVPWY